MKDPWQEYVQGGVDEADRLSEAPLPVLVSSSDRAAWLYVFVSAGMILWQTVFALETMTNLLVDFESFPSTVAQAVLFVAAGLAFPVTFIVLSARRRGRRQGLHGTSFPRLYWTVLNGDALGAAAGRLGWSENLRYLQMTATGAAILGWLVLMTRFVLGDPGVFWGR